MKILLALAIGGLFGFVLDRIGATNPSVLIRMLSLRALGLMKAILLAIGVGSILMFGGQMTGLVDVGHMSVKPPMSACLWAVFCWVRAGPCLDFARAPVSALRQPDAKMRCFSSLAGCWGRLPT